MKPAFVYIGRLIAILALLYLLSNLKTYYSEIPPLKIDENTILYFSGAVLFCWMNIVASALVWTLIVRRTGAEIDFWEGYTIFGLSQIGKYLPGNIFHYAGRTVLGKEKGIPMASLAFSMGVETLIILLTASLIAVCGIAADFSGLGSLRLLGEFPSVRHYTILLLIAGGAGALASKVEVRRWLHQHLSLLPFRNMALYSLVYLGGFLGFGVLLDLVLKGAWSVHTDLQWYHLAWGFSLAWVAGFLMPGAPGGIGIREAVLVGIWSADMGEGLALGMAFLLRIFTSLGDLVSFVAAYTMKKLPPRHGNN